MHRIIYALELDLGSDQLGQSHQLIAWLDPGGNCAFIQPESKRRAVDLRVGDFVIHDGQRHQVRGIRAYRENVVSWSVDDQGWLTRLRAG